MESSKFMNRREFLMSVSGIALIGMGAYPLLRPLFTPVSSVPLPLPSAPTIAWNGQVKSFHFLLHKGTVQLGNGRAFTGYLINQQYPGPEIRVREGDKVNITLSNQLDQPTTLHWHGVNVPSPMDGVPGISQNPVDPGETFTYEFIAGPAGTRWYHSHVYEMEQIPGGLFGPLIVESADPRDRDLAQREQTLLLSSWGYQPGKGLDYGMQRGGASMGMGSTGAGAGGMQSSSPSLTQLVNGVVPSALTPIDLRPGEKLRLRLINGSATESYLLAMDGTFLVTHADGNPLPAPHPASELYIAPSERYDIVITPPATGLWYLRSRISGQQSVQIPFRTTGSATNHTAATAGAWSYTYSGTSSARLPSVQRQFQLSLSGGMMQNQNWTINGKPYPNSDPLRIKSGERVRIEMRNMSMMEHPMHLHGHSFAITSFNGHVLTQPLVKDVVNLRPMERCTIDFEAYNPGNWFFHCHNLQHMRNGLATVVEYVDYPYPHVDKWM